MAGIAEVAGAALGATPYGALAGAAAQVATAALQDTPTNITSGGGPVQFGSFTVGSKVVGKGNTAGGTTSAQSQTPISESPGASVGAPNTKTLLIAGGIAAFIALFYLLSRRNK